MIRAIAFRAIASIRVITRQTKLVAELGEGWKVTVIFKNGCQKIVQTQLEHVPCWCLG